MELKPMGANPLRPGIALVLALLGCGDGTAAASLRDAGSEPPEDGGASTVRWVGAVENTDVRVAVLAGRGRARVYFCGGAESYAVATRWFSVLYDGGEHLELEEDTWRIHAHLTLGGLIGDVELGDGVARSVRAQEVEPSTIAGLYEGKADCGRVGLIVTQATPNELPTAQGACTNTRKAQQVQPIEPITAEEGKLWVRQPGGAGEEVLLLRAATLEP